MLKRICAIVTLLVSFSAAANAGLMVAPTRQEVTLKPGSAFEGSYKVTNDFGKDVSLKVDARYWFNSKEEENTKITDWLEISTTGFTFGPNESVDVKYRINLSTSMTGMRAAMISFRPSDQDDQGVTLVVSVSLFVTVAGTEIEDWDIESPKITNYQGTSQFSVMVKNNGNIHVRPRGTVRVISKKRKEINLNILDSRPAYPGQDRQIVANANEKDIFPKPGKYTVIFNVTGNQIQKEQIYKVKVKRTGAIIIK